MTTQSYPAEYVNLHLGAPPQIPALTMRITMKTRKVYTDASILSTGSTYTVTLEWGQMAVEQGWASDTDRILPKTMQQQTLTSLQTTALDSRLVDPTSVTAILLVGDSNSAFYQDQGPSVTNIYDNGDNTATVVFSGSHNFSVGQTITINASPIRYLNCFNALITAQLNTNPYYVVYKLGGRTSPVTSAAASGTSTFYPLRYSPLGYATWLQCFQSKQLTFGSAAAGGADSTQILTLFNDSLNEASTFKTTDVIVMAGTNDIFARGWDFATTQLALKNLLDTIIASTKARVWWLTILPVGSGASGWTAGKQVILNRINRWIWRYATQIGVTPVDSWKCVQQGLTVVNPAAGTPDPTTSFLGADALHTANLGALALARGLNALMQQTTALQSQQFQGGHLAIQNQGNALTNSSLTGTGGTKTAGAGTITGNAPDSWTVEISSGSGTITLTSPARTVAADGDASGNNLQVIPSVAAVTWRLMNTTSLHTAVTAGEVREASIPINITGAAGLTGIELIIFGANATMGNTNFGITGTSNAITGDFVGVLRTRRWTVPSGLTSLSFFVRFTQTGVPAGTFILGKPALELIE